MLKRLSLICFVLSYFVTAQGQLKSAILSGNISNTQENVIKISFTELNFEHKIAIDSNGNFRDTLYLPENGNYFYSVGKSASMIKLKDGYDLHLSLDADDFYKSILFSGIGSEMNNFNTQLSQLKTSKVGDAKEFFIVPLNDFIEKLSDNRESYLALLNEAKLEEHDKILMTKIIETDHILVRNNYDKFYFYHTKVHPELPSNYYDPVLAIDVDDQELFLHDKNFRILVIENYRQTLKLAKDADPTLSNIAFVRNSSKNIKSQYIRESIISMLFNNVNNKNPNYYTDYEEIMALLVSQPMKDKLNGRLSTAKNTTTGAKSASFQYENLEGEIVSLSDFKGKYVYIDIWATWCGPCIKQMPALKELIKEYEGKNIAFVVISIDDKKDIEKWKKMVPIHNVGGTHLISDDKLASEFMKAYSVGLIPRSILLDQEGKVLNNMAPKPSDSSIRGVIDGLLNNNVKTIK